MESREFPIIATATTNYYTGTFDGQGYAISNLYVNTSNQYVGLFGRVNYTATIKDFSVYGEVTYTGTAKSSYVGTIGWMISSSAESSVEDIKSYINFTSTGATNMVGGIVGRLDASTCELTVNRCAYYGTIDMGSTVPPDVVGGIVGYAGATNTIDNCLYAGVIKAGDATNGSTGGILGYASVATFRGIFNSLSVGTIGALGKARGALAGKLGTSTSALKSYPSNNYYTATAATNSTNKNQAYDGQSGVWTDVPTQIADGDATLTDGTLVTALGSANWTQGTSYPVPEASDVEPEPEVVHVHQYSANGFCTNTVLTCDTPYEAYTVADDGVYHVANGGQFLKFAAFLNTNKVAFAGSIVLDGDCDLESREFAGLATNNSYPFRGTFDGKGHSISNMVISSSARYVGLFPFTRGCTIRDFSLYGSVTSTYTNTNNGFNGGVIGYLNNYPNDTDPALIEDVRVFVDITASVKNSTGGIVGYVSQYGTTNSTITINRCWYGGTINSGEGVIDCLGGIAGNIHGNHVISNCLFTGSIKGSYTSAGQAGGIIGYSSQATFKGIFNSLSMGTIEAVGLYRGALAGRMTNAGPRGTCANNFYTATAAANATSLAYDGQNSAWSNVPTLLADDDARLSNGTVMLALGRDNWVQGDAGYPIPEVAEGLTYLTISSTYGETSPAVGVYAIDADGVEVTLVKSSVITDFKYYACSSYTLNGVTHEYTAGESVKVTKAASGADSTLVFNWEVAEPSETVSSPEAMAKRIDMSFEGTADDGFPSSTIENFVMKLELSEATIEGFKYSDFGMADFSDLLILDDNGQRLDYDWETIDTNGTSVLWVKFPTFARGTNFMLFYGADIAAENHPKAVWENYLAVYHLDEGSGTAVDSTSNHLDGAYTPTAKYPAMVTVPHDDLLNLGDVYTVAGWGKLSSASDLWSDALFSKYENGVGTNIWARAYRGVAGGYGFPGVMFGSTQIHQSKLTNDLVTASHYFTFVQSGTTTRIYLDGVLQVAKTDASNVSIDNSGDFIIGETWRGTISEVRVSKEALSSAKIAADYYTQGGLAITSSAAADNDMNLVIVSANGIDLGVATPAYGEYKTNEAFTASLAMTKATVDDITYAVSGWELLSSTDSGKTWTTKAFSSNYHVGESVSVAAPAAGENLRLVWKWAEKVTGIADYETRTRHFTVTLKDDSNGTLGGKTYENIPVPVRLSESIPGFVYRDFNSTSGLDLMFVDSEGRVLPYDVDQWNTSGESIVWVRVRKAYAGAVIHGFYHGDAIAASKNAVWKEYAGVWHMAETTGLYSNDSTKNGLNGENSADLVTSTDGQFGRSRQPRWNNMSSGGTGGQITVPSYDHLKLGSTFVVSTWYKHHNIDTADGLGYGQNDRFFTRRIGEIKDGGKDYGYYESYDGWAIQYLGQYGADASYNGPRLNVIADDADQRRKCYYDDGVTPSNTWNNVQRAVCLPNAEVDADDVDNRATAWAQVTIQYEGTEVSVYTNGYLSGSYSFLFAPTDNGQPLIIGNTPTYTAEGYTAPPMRCFNGRMDEVRLRGGTLDADWIAANYFFQANPSAVEQSQVEAQFVDLIVEGRDYGDSYSNDPSWSKVNPDGAYPAYGDYKTNGETKQLTSGGVVTHNGISYAALSYTVQYSDDNGVTWFEDDAEHPGVYGTFECESGDTIAVTPVVKTTGTGEFTGATLGRVTRFIWNWKHVGDNDRSLAYTRTFVLTLPAQLSNEFHTVAADGSIVPTKFTNLVCPLFISEEVDGFAYWDFKTEDYSDLIFVDEDDPENCVVMPYDVEKWNTNGESVVWVRVASAYGGKKIHAYYRGPSSGNEAKNCWTDYKGVWHFSDVGLDRYVTDSSGNGMYGEYQSWTAASEDGVFANCCSGGGIPVNTASTSHTEAESGVMTVSGWFKHSEDAVANFETFFSTRTNVTDLGGILIAATNNTSIIPYPYRNLYDEAEQESTREKYAHLSIELNNEITSIPSEWERYSVVYNGFTVSLYVNGRLQGSHTYPEQVLQYNGSNVMIGGMLIDENGESKNRWNGLMDEVRLDGRARTADELRAAYIVEHYRDHQVEKAEWVHATVDVTDNKGEIGKQLNPGYGERMVTNETAFTSGVAYGGGITWISHRVVLQYSTDEGMSWSEPVTNYAYQVGENGVTETWNSEEKNAVIDPWAAFMFTPPDIKDRKWYRLTWIWEPDYTGTRIVIPAISSEIAVGNLPADDFETDETSANDYWAAGHEQDMATEVVTLDKAGVDAMFKEPKVGFPIEKDGEGHDVAHEKARQITGFADRAFRTPALAPVEIDMMVEFKKPLVPVEAEALTNMPFIAIAAHTNNTLRILCRPKKGMGDEAEFIQAGSFTEGEWIRLGLVLDFENRLIQVRTNGVVVATEYGAFTKEGGQQYERGSWYRSAIDYQAIDHLEYLDFFGTFKVDDVVVTSSAVTNYTPYATNDVDRLWLSKKGIYVPYNWMAREGRDNPDEPFFHGQKATVDERYLAGMLDLSDLQPFQVNKAAVDKSISLEFPGEWPAESYQIRVLKPDGTEVATYKSGDDGVSFEKKSEVGSHVNGATIPVPASVTNGTDKVLYFRVVRPQTE